MNSHESYDVLVRQTVWWETRFLTLQPVNCLTQIWICMHSSAIGRGHVDLTVCFFSPPPLVSDVMRGGPDQTRLHVILRGEGEKNTFNFRAAAFESWPSPSHGDSLPSRLLSVTVRDIFPPPAFRIVTRCSSENGRHSVCAAGGQAGCSSGAAAAAGGGRGERKGGRCSDWADRGGEGKSGFTSKLAMSTVPNAFVGAITISGRSVSLKCWGCIFFSCHYGTGAACQHIH